MAIVQAMRKLGPRLAESRSADVHVRVGIHTGAVVVGAMGGPDRPQSLAIGETVNMADRVQRAATPDSVLVSEATYRLTRGYFNFRDLGPQDLKGFSQAVPLYEVLGETGVRSRLDVAAVGGLTPFAGRDRELREMLDRWEQAKAGRGPVLLLGGEPGIGKSRHVRVLKEHLGGETFLSIDCFCSQYYQSTALHPIIEMMERRLAFTRDLTVEEKLGRLEAELVRVGLPAASTAPLLASLLSLPLGERYPPLDLVPQRQRQATFDVLAQWLLAYTKDHPVLFVIEDLHWADPSTLEFLGIVLRRETSDPIMVLLVHRPEFKPPWEHPRLAQLTLGRLPADESERMLARITRNRALPPEVARHVLDRADGVPLFVEELTKAIIESGALREGDRKFELVASPSALMIPSTVQDSLMARLDRLGGTKALAQIAATLGRTFSFDVLCAVTGMPEAALRLELSRLVEAELLFKRGDPVNETYIFKHALIQDAAYESLLRSTRQRYHHQIARTLVEQFPEVAEGRPELLAQHYAGAGLPSEAIGQWTVAGQRAIARSAFAEAINVFGKALDTLPLLPASEDRDRLEIELRAGLGLALISTRGFSSKEVEDTYARARELCERFGDVPMRILFGIWAVQIVRGDREATAKLAVIFRRIAEKSSDPAERLIAHACLVTRSFYLADYEDVRREANKGKAYCDPLATKAQSEVLMREYGYEGLLYSHLFLAWTDAIQGRLDECRSGLREALELAERTGHPYILSMALAFGAAVWRDIGELPEAAQWAARSVELCKENGFIFWLGGCLCVSGWLTRAAGDGPTGLGLIEQGMAIFRQIGALIICPYYLTYLAESHLEDGRVDEGLSSVAEARGISETNLSCNSVPELLRLQGELLGRARHEDAEPHLRSALDLSRSQGAALYELRSALALGRLLKAEGRGAEARGLLNEVSARVPGPLWNLTEGRAVRELLSSVS
jgi:tetratricopeptide (TPR) repeat protein